MALFRRKAAVDSPVVPEEVNQYYQSENRERTWMAWLLALVSLAVAALVVMALFFGGRWIYRKARHQSTPVATQKANQPDNKSASNPAPNASNPATSPNPAPATTPSTGNVSAPANPGNSGSSSTTAPATTSNPAGPTVASNSNLPSTGPGDTIGIFVAVSILAYILHRQFSVKTN